MIREELELYELLKDMPLEYPNFWEWFGTKVIPGLADGTRRIFTRRVDNKLAGVAIVKKTENERKLCTLFVKEEYASRGTGLFLLDASLKFLETDTPNLTVPLSKLEKFERIFERYEFVKDGRVKGLYKPGAEEVYFNSRKLVLNLKGLYFDEIKSGVKDFEYREPTEHWKPRLAKSFDIVSFRKGYPKKDDNSKTLDRLWLPPKKDIILHPLFGDTETEVFAIPTTGREVIK